MTERAAPEPWACKRCGWRSNAQGFKAGVPFPVCTRCNTLDDSNSPAPNARMDALVEKLRHGNLHDLAEIAPAAADRITALEAERDSALREIACVMLAAGVSDTSSRPVYCFVDDMRARAEQAERELAAAGAVIAELVACKNLKDAPVLKMTKETELRRMDYERRKPLAWAAAREYLARRGAK